MKVRRLLCIARLFSPAFVLAFSSTGDGGASSVSIRKVAVIGTTGKLGSEVVSQLSKKGIATRCLLRHDISSITTPPASLEQATSSAETAAYLNTLPGVEMVQGDVSDVASLRTLLTGCDACLALYGPTVPKPFFKALFPFWYPETDPQHPKQVNYLGVQNLITVLQEENPTMRLVRITGKGENPWSIFSILINAFGGIAKGWNYEAEQLLRKSETDYTIIRPGIMKDTVDDDDPTLGLLDNGRDLPVTAVSYAQIANLAVQVLGRNNCRRATLTAMNVNTTTMTTTDYQTLDEVQPDSRQFPESLISEHKKAARVGGLAFMGISLLLAKFVAILVGKLFRFK